MIRLFLMLTHTNDDGIFYHMPSPIQNMPSQKKSNRAFFLDRDGVINEECSYITQTDQMTLIPGSAEAIQKINQSGFLAIVVTNQAMIGKGLCTLNQLTRIHDYLQSTLQAQGATLDAIFFCPHHPAPPVLDKKNPYQTVCSCRKPKPSLILAASEQFDIDLRQSVLIGDHPRDIAAGKAAGVSTIGVKTGHGHRLSASDCDHIESDLLAAVIRWLN